MAININEARNLVLFIANKSQAGVNPTPSEFNTIAKNAQIKWITTRYSIPERYRYDVSEPVIAFQQTQKISDDLRFLVEKDTISIDSNGQFDYPSDYLHLSSIRTTHAEKDCDDNIVSFEVDVKIRRDSEIGNILSSKIVGPTKRYPSAVMYNDYIQVYPKDIPHAIFTYIREPNDPVWAYTTINNRPVYDPASSVDFELPSDAINGLCAIMLSYLGIFIREPELQQYSELMKQEGA